MITLRLCQDLSGQLERLNGQGWNLKSTGGGEWCAKRDPSTRARNLSQVRI